MSVDDFDSGAEERAFNMQEAALGDEPFDVALAQALRTPPLPPIPADFAVITATLAEGARADDDRLEWWLQATSTLLLGASAAAAAAVGGGEVARAIAVVAPAIAAGPPAAWSAAIVACLVLSLGLDRWIRRTRILGAAVR